jgi:hypothetical protein
VAMVSATFGTFANVRPELLQLAKVSHEPRHGPPEPRLTHHNPINKRGASENAPHLRLKGIIHQKNQAKGKGYDSLA